MCVKFLICMYIVFIILFNFVSLSSCSSLSFLKTNVLNSLLGKWQLSISLGWIIGNLLCFLVVVCFIDFSCLLKSYVALHLASVSSLRESEAFSRFFRYILAVAFWKRLNAFTQSWKARLGADSLAFAFPVLVLTAQLYALTLSSMKFRWLSVLAQ